jgi:HEPN domain-containing protein
VVDESVDPSAEEAIAWLGKAREDLAVAELIRASPLGVNWAVCFHAQQAAEKALKALLVLLGVDFPRTHTLELLADLVPDEPRRQLDRPALVDLTPWAVAGRYPEDIENPPEDEAAVAVATAKTVIEVAGRLIGETP